MKSWMLFGVGAFLALTAAAQAGDISKCLGDGGHWSCVTGEAGASTSRPTSGEEALRLQIRTAQIDAVDVLNGLEGSDRFFQAAANAQDLLQNRFESPYAAAIAILDISNAKN